MRRGPHDSIPENQVPGTILIETDTGNVFVDDTKEAGGRIQLSAKSAIYDLNGTPLVDKVDKVDGKQLSTNDYTDQEKNKLTSVEENAQPNVQSDWNVSDSSMDEYIKNRTHYRSVSALDTIQYAQIQANWNDVSYTLDSNITLRYMSIFGSMVYLFVQDTLIKYNIILSSSNASEVHQGHEYATSHTLQISGQSSPVNCIGFSIDSEAFGKIWILCLPDNSQLRIFTTGNTEPYSNITMSELVMQSVDAYNKLDANYIPDVPAISLKNARYLEGVTFDGTANTSYYGVCKTSASEQIKICPCTGLSLVSGARIFVKFVMGNTNTSNIALNVNNTGPKGVAYRGSVLSDASLATSISANQIIEFVYDGNYWNIVGYLPEAIVPTDLTIDDGSID